ncbi:hypothetical protein ON010_g8749 [Phytophthora cinnamomi]|nr:hypothetical protein ON010_g8749 [Phytophthora cinnamomi]
MSTPVSIDWDRPAVHVAVGQGGSKYAVKLATLKVSSATLRRVARLQNLLKRRMLKVQYVPTSENIADMFTKALGPEQFEKLRRLLGVEDVVAVVDRRVGATIVQVKSSTDVHQADDENDKDT